MKLDPLDSLDLSVNRSYEPFQTSLVEKWITPGDTVIDIGANIGYYTLIFARGVGPGGKVFAFEPEPNSFVLLTENMRRNNYKNVEAIQKAASDKNGTVTLFKDAFNNLDHKLFPSRVGGEKSISVETIRFDDLVTLKNNKVDLIKMDIQGAELLALKGMTELISNNSDLILVLEFWPPGLKNTGSDPKELYDLLISFGFALYDVDEDQRTLSRVPSLNELLIKCATKPFYTNLACFKGKLPMGVPS